MRRLLAVLLLGTSSCVYPNHYHLNYRPAPDRTLFESQGLIFFVQGSSPVADYREPLFDAWEAADHVDFTVTVRNPGKEPVQWSTETAELRGDRAYRPSNGTVVPLAASESKEIWLRFELDLKTSITPRFDASLKLGEAIRPGGERAEVVVPLDADLQLRDLGNVPRKRGTFLQ